MLFRFYFTRHSLRIASNLKIFHKQMCYEYLFEFSVVFAIGSLLLNYIQFFSETNSEI